MTRARVKPELIRWVRKDAGLSVADAAKKAGTSEAIVRQWEEGTLQPTIRQLRLLANAARRPIAIFYRDRSSHRPEDSAIEVFCNAVAAETLVPRRDFVRSPLVRDHPQGAAWQEPELRSLARDFSVLWEVVLRRLLDTGQITRGAYRDRREAMLAGYRVNRSAQTGFVTPDVAAVASLGQEFVKLVLVSYYQDRITSRDVSEYLGVRLKHMARIEERVMGSRVMFG